MNRLFRFALIGIVLALLAAAVAVIAHAQHGQDPHIWGTYVWITQTPNGPAPSLVTLNIDGTVSLSDGAMFGGNNLANRLTPARGVWERTGDHSFGGTSLWLIVDAASGAMKRYGRSRVTAEFVDFNHFQGKLFVETLTCSTQFTCPDPLDPGANWVANPGVPPDGISIGGARLERVPAGPLQP
jgi:hypothetical protein